MLSNDIKRTLKTELERLEGRVPHMYQCTAGHVTIGIGHLIIDATSAERLDLRKQNGSAASTTEKRTEYETIRALPRNGNNAASYYSRHTTLTMPHPEIERLRDLHIFNFHRELKILFPEFDSFPNEVKLALFDMIFNLGMTRFRRARWPKLHEAIQNRNWEEAATESYRPRISIERNVYVRDLFLKAAAEEES